MRIRTEWVATAILAAAVVAPVHAETDVKPLYEKYCKVCHSIAGDGGKQADKGGPLDHVGSKHDADWLKKYIADPKSVIAESKMPKLKMTDEELDAYVQFMLSLK